jgi:RNA recognition motif-containing protein
MPSKLFIGNLSFNVADSELNELFASLNIPVTSIMLMRDTETGRSRGFAFAELAPEADMESAIKQLNATEVGGRSLTVNEARPKAVRSGGFDGGQDHRRRSEPRW